MGIDLDHGGRKVGHKHRTQAKSQNVYVNLLVKLYKFLARRTDSGFNAVVAKRLMMSRTHRPPLGLARVLRYMKGKEDKFAVVIGSVTDDVRLTGHDIPALKLVALHVTEGARARILAAGGEIFTLDQFAMMAPTGSNAILLRGRKTARTAVKHFGTPGKPGSKTRPYVRSEGRKFERARGRRKSRGFKV